MKVKKNSHRIKSLFSKLVTIICLIVFIYSLYELSVIGLDYYHNRQVLAEAQEIYRQASNEENDNKSTNMNIRQQFKQLHEINPDIVGWITINGTKINYPILQAENNNYYLTRNYKHETSRAGSIFMDYRNDLLSDEKNIILYGHRMKDETMFQQLTKYVDKGFFKKNKNVFFDTMYDSYNAEIFSVYYTTTDFDYIKTDFSSKDDYAQLLKEIKQKSLHDVDLNVTPDDTILTLSTCDYTLDPDEGRLVVHAKIIDSK